MTNRFCSAGRSWALLPALACCLAFAPAARAQYVPALENSHRNTERTRMVERAQRSSVNIHTEKRQKSMDVVFTAGKGTKINGMGTGIVIDERGYIVTNYHVVQDVERLRVTTYSGVEYDAAVVTVETKADLAIIKIDPVSPLEVARFGTSSDLMLGEDVIAIGNAYGYESTVTRGIISHRSRDVAVNEEQSYEDLIQIDAAINPGNSGGPLLNADGEIIGINVAIRAGAQRIGFAIPIDQARQTIAKLMSSEYLQKTYHGITAVDFKQGTDRKLVVKGANADSPALPAGLKPGDVIIRSGEVPVTDNVDLERSLIGSKAGASVPLTVLRNGEQMHLTMTLGEVSPSRRAPPQNVAAVPPPVNSGVISRIDQETWTTLGLKMAKVNDGFPIPGQPYRGGMKVLAVRQQSPAELNGIREGDILVGLHIWETVSDENVEFVLHNPQLSSIGPLKFYIVRNGETLFGHFRLQVAQR